MVRNAEAPPTRAGILVGGASRRMGTTKALLQTGGSTLLERTVQILRTVLDHPFVEVVLIGRPHFALPSGADINRVADRPRLGGPLAALLGAFDAAPRAAWLVVACDLPCLEASAISWLLAQRQPLRVAVIPRLGARAGRIEPLLALYEPAARPLLERLALEPEAAGRSLQRLYGLPGVASPVVPAALRPSWTNVNTPDDWRDVELGLRTPPSRSTSPKRPAPRAPGRRQR